MNTERNTKHGHLQLIFGPMFSGKSSELIRRVRRYQLSNYPCLIIRYANDVRYSDSEVATHCGRTYPAVNALVLSSVHKEASESKVIGIDEGQFFPDIVDFCKEFLREGKIIIVAGLDGTYQRVGFGEILHLVPLAKSVDKLTAICMCCGGKAAFTRRIVDDEQIEVIGGADKYMAVCRECYNVGSPKKTTPFKNMSVPKYIKKENQRIMKSLFVE